MVATWALRVVPAGVPLRGLDMSLDNRLFAVSVETAGSVGSESMAVVLSDPLADSGRWIRPIQLHISPLPQVD